MDHLSGIVVSISCKKKRCTGADIVSVSVVSCAAFFFVTLFQCNPISYFWNTSTQDGTCVNIEIIIALGYLYSVFSIISDFTFAILPAFLIMTLQLKLRTKIALIPLLAMGCMSVYFGPFSSGALTKFQCKRCRRCAGTLYAPISIARFSLGDHRYCNLVHC